MPKALAGIAPKAPLRKRASHLTRKHRFHVAHSIAHLTYCAAAIIEGNGLYAAASGVMLIFAVFNLIAEMDSA
jgi:hypothetical protein